MAENKLRICFVTSMHDWNDDRIFERAAVGLATLGHHVTYIAPADKDFESEGVFIKAIPKRNRWQKHIFGPGEAFKRMKEVDADIFHFFNPNLMWKMRAWSKKGNNVFIDIHENYESRVDAFYLPYFLRKLLVNSYRKIENWMCSHYKGITVVTQSMAEKLASSRVPILVVDNVPYLRRLAHVELANTKDQNPTIITSGTHSNARNCLKAIEALPIILKVIPNVQMKFVGRFQPLSFESELRQRAMILGVSQNLKIEGMLPWLENFKRISTAHIGCVFYNDNLNNRVTLPNRLYEYMFCGLAVLGEDFPEVKKVLNKTGSGCVVKSQDPQDIAQKAILLLQDKQYSEQAGQRGREAILKDYNFEKALIELENLYRSV